MHVRADMKIELCMYERERERESFRALSLLKCAMQSISLHMQFKMEILKSVSVSVSVYASCACSYVCQTYCALLPVEATTQSPSLRMQSKVEIFQWVEDASSRTTKDSVGGGSTTVTTYSYRKEWRISYMDQRSECLQRFLSLSFFPVLSHRDRWVMSSYGRWRNMHSETMCGKISIRATCTYRKRWIIHYSSENGSDCESRLCAWYLFALKVKGYRNGRGALSSARSIRTCSDTYGSRDTLQ